MHKKENPKTASERVRKYRSNPEHKTIEIVGVMPQDKERFLNLSGLEKVNHINKLKILMDIWENYSEDIMNYLLDNQYKDLILEDALLLKECEIVNIEITNFIQEKKIPIKDLCLKLKRLSEYNIKKEFYESYLFYLKSFIPKNKPRIFPFAFLDMILDKKNIEQFKQKIEAERMEREAEKNLKLAYINQEISKASLYLIDKKDLYFELIKKYRATDDNKHIGLKVLSSSIPMEKLIGNKTIIKELLPDIQKRPDYPFTSFEDWKIHNSTI